MYLCSNDLLTVQAYEYESYEYTIMAYNPHSERICVSPKNLFCSLTPPKSSIDSSIISAEYPYLAHGPLELLLLLASSITGDCNWNQLIPVSETVPIQVSSNVSETSLPSPPLESPILSPPNTTSLLPTARAPPATHSARSTERGLCLTCPCRGAQLLMRRELGP